MSTFFQLLLHPTSTRGRHAGCRQLLAGVPGQHLWDRGSWGCSVLGKLPLFPIPQEAESALRGGGWKLRSESTILHPFQKASFSCGVGDPMHCLHLSEVRWSLLLLEGVWHSWNWLREHVDCGGLYWDNPSRQKSIEMAWRLEDH